MLLRRNLGQKIPGQCPAIIITRILAFMIKPMRQKVQSTNISAQHALQMGGKVSHIQKPNVGTKIKNLSQKRVTGGTEANACTHVAKDLSN